jgi:hypothetical protein
VEELECILVGNHICDKCGFDLPGHESYCPRKVGG